MPPKKRNSQLKTARLAKKSRSENNEDEYRTQRFWLFALIKKAKVWFLVFVKHKCFCLSFCKSV
jgi:hypothetical protein